MSYCLGMPSITVRISDDDMAKVEALAAAFNAAHPGIKANPSAVVREAISALHEREIGRAYTREEEAAGASLAAEHAATLDALLDASKGLAPAVDYLRNLKPQTL